jgi:tetratricopeptide (TPR) repeat protein
MRLYNEALEKLREAIAMDPYHCTAHLGLTLVHMQLGNFAEALEEFERASRLNDFPTIMAYLGQVYAVSGERDEAQRVLERCKSNSRNASFRLTMWH